MQQPKPHPNEAPVPRVIASVLLAASVLPIMQAGLLAPALPLIGEELGGRPNATLLVRVMLVAPTIAIVLCAPFVGAAADRIGAKGLLAGALGLYGLCGLIAAASHDLEQLIAVRIVLGLALAAISTVTAILIAAYFRSARRDQVLGWQAALVGLSGAAFPAAGGLLASAGWRYAFLPYALSLLLLATMPLFPRASRQSDAGLAAAPLSSPSLVLVYALAFFGALSLYLLPTQLAFHMREHGSTSPSLAGIALAIASLAAAAASMLYPRVRRRLRFAPVAALSFCFIALGYGAIGMAISPGLFAAGLAIAGLGFGLNLPNCTAWLLSRAPENIRGRAAGGLATSMFLGQFLSPFLYDPVVAYHGSSAAFLDVAGASLAIAAVVAWRVATGAE
jgi:MFS family permease